MILPVAQPTPNAYEWLKAYVIALPSDEDAFLNEGALATDAGTSRTPIREALFRLESEGFLKRIPNKGAYVPALTDPDIRALMEARGVVERWAAQHGLLALQNSAGTLQSILDQQSASTGDIRAFIELDIDFHTRMVRVGNNPVLTDFYSSLRQRQLRVGVKAVTHGHARDQEVLVEHQGILDAIVSGDADEILRRIDSHLHSTLLAVTST